MNLRWGILHFFIYIVQTGNKRRDGVIPPYDIPKPMWYYSLNHLVKYIV